MKNLIAKNHKFCRKFTFYQRKCWLHAKSYTVVPLALQCWRLTTFGPIHAKKNFVHRVWVRHNSFLHKYVHLIGWAPDFATRWQGNFMSRSQRKKPFSGKCFHSEQILALKTVESRIISMQVYSSAVTLWLIHNLNPQWLLLKYAFISRFYY